MGPFGINIQHVESSQLVSETSKTLPEYYLNPLGIIYWNMGAAELNSSMSLALDTPNQCDHGA